MLKYNLPVKSQDIAEFIKELMKLHIVCKYTDKLIGNA